MCRGSNSSPARPADTTWSIWPTGKRAAVGVVATGEMLLRDVASRVERLAVHEGQLGVGRSEIGQPNPPVDVLAEVDDLATGVDAANVDGPHLLDAANRW